MVTAIYPLMNSRKSTYFQLIPLLSIILLLSCQATDEQAGGPTDISLTWKLVENEDDGTHNAWIRLVNKGSAAIGDDGWAIYWNMAPREVFASSIEEPVEIRWINGDFYTLLPKPGFELAPGDSIQIDYKGSDWMIKESDAPLGVYLVVNDTAKVIQDYRILPFDTPGQINRTSADMEPIPGAEALFEQYSVVENMDIEDVIPVIPTPREFRKGTDSVRLDTSVMIQHEAGLGKEVALFISELNNLFSGTFGVKTTNDPGPGKIQFILAEQEITGSYELRISPDSGIVVRADAPGVFHATRTLLQLIPPKAFSTGVQFAYLPELHIRDEPAFGYRGFFIDICRNFNSVETVKRVLDVMALYKLNKLHIHLTEDEAWRIEIEELPELTEYGSVRGHTTDESFHLAPAYGSGPETDPVSGYGSGYYTRAQFKDLIKYAHDRHIEVIPEFNMPGHSRAAIKSMEYRYRKYMAKEQPEEAEKYRLADPQDASEYRSAQWYTDNTTCVCRESAFTFVKTVIDDVLEMYQEAGVPLSMFHMGGDEVPVGAWTESPLCQEFMEAHPEIDNERNLQKYFFRRINNYLSSKGILTAGWEEVAQNFQPDGSWTVNEEFADGQVVPYVWNSLWGAEDLGYRLANAGYPVVLCNVTNFYFDLAYNKDPREPGLYWGGFVDTRDAYSFVPYDMFQSIKVSAMCEPYEDKDFAGKERLTGEGKKNILGIQAQLWAETIKGRDMVEYYIFPKMFGLAERAWAGTPSWSSLYPESREPAADKSWSEFANRIGRFGMPLLENLNNGYNFRLPPPGAVVRDGKIIANVLYPGLEIRYTTDGTMPDVSSSLYTGPIDDPGTTVKLITVDGRGRTSYATKISR